MHTSTPNTQETATYVVRTEIKAPQRPLRLPREPVFVVLELLVEGEDTDEGPEHDGRVYHPKPDPHHHASVHEVDVLQHVFIQVVRYRCIRS